jgi:hypothetical protein
LQQFEQAVVEIVEGERFSGHAKILC